MKLKKGDTVKVIAGKDKGKTGEVTKTYTSANKVLVQGINVYKKHLKAREGIEGGIYPLERPIDISKVALMDPVANVPTRIGYKVLDSGKKIRIAKKSGTEIDNVKAKSPKTTKKGDSKKTKPTTKVTNKKETKKDK